MKNLITIIAIIGVSSVSTCFALDTGTHQYLNDKISQTSTNNATVLDDYLRSQLGIKNGIKEPLSSSISGKTLKIHEWLRDGGLYEDKPPLVPPYIRSANHFHNPIRDEGFTGVPSGDSAIVWAQKPKNQQWVGGHYSWPDSRENFYSALIATDKTSRDEIFAEMFRGVGQLMHLMQDMSVPEHARNDFHAFPAYEEWLKEKPSLQYIDAALAAPVTPDASLLKQQSSFANATIPFANLFDTNQYEGATADGTTSLAYGLSEYTNANFFSPDTIFDANYPFPRWASVQEWDDTVNGKKRTYLRKVADGEQINHAATARWFYKYLPTAMKSTGLKLDDNVYADYAQLLLPRAVGYSAALLDYFFRGKLTLSANPTDTSFSKIIVSAANDTTGEAMGSGTVSLVIRYKPLNESLDNGSTYKLSNPAAEYRYRVVTYPTQVDLSSPKQLTFDFGTDPLPAYFSDMTMQLVYRGPLGNETDSVAVSELKPVDGIYSDFAVYLPDTGVYAKTIDGSIAADFRELRVNVATDQNGSGLTGGTFYLNLTYRSATADPFQSQPVTTNPPDGYAYMLKLASNVTSLPAGSSAELVFDLSAAPLPVWATDVRLAIIYADANGNILATGFKDISEPTPMDVFNNADQVCVNNTWYNAGDPATLALRDADGSLITDKTDLYAHNIANIYSKASASANSSLASISNFTFSSPATLTGNSKRTLGYILTDYSFKYSNLEDWLDADPTDPWYTVEPAGIYTGTAIKNQDGTYPGMFSIRGQKLWWGAGVVYDNEEYPPGSDADTACGWQNLPQP